MAELTTEQSVFLKQYIKAKVEAGDPQSKELLEIRTQLDKDGYFEKVKEDVLQGVADYNDGLGEGEEPVTLSEDDLATLVYRSMKYDDSDYGDYLRDLVAEYVNENKAAVKS